MGRNRTDISVTAVYDGELDAADVFVGLIAERCRTDKNTAVPKEYFAKKHGTVYNDIGVQKSQEPSGLWG